MTRLVRFALFFIMITLSSASANDVRDLAERLEAKAVNGDVKAAYKLGLLWSNGKKVRPDYITALEWFERAGQQGYVRAMLKLSELYLDGKAVPPDLDRVQFWLEKAANAGSDDAMAKLGQFFAGKNEREQSIYWYKKAAVKGEASAMRELGLAYYKGDGVRFDLDHAFAWLELAMRKKDRGAEPLQRSIIQKKGQGWADDVRRQIDNRMIPQDYWNAR
ncbi:MAG: tetratricopeptide repeat protein [Terasakiella sp.]|uniref:tetratricopeptide repeat protein n=1 Tax=unclassified Terasakiella TaxID=2614952 RepID=UPI003B000246